MRRFMTTEIFDGIGNPEKLIGGRTLGIEVIGEMTHIEKVPYSAVHLHLGDATLLAALRSLSQPGTASIVIDRNTHAMSGLGANLGDGTDFVGTLDNSSEYRELQDALRDGEIRRLIGDAYKKAADAAFQNIESLYLIGGNIEDQSAKYPFADLVTIFNPHPRDDLGKILIYAANALKTGGTVEFLTENWMRADEARTYAGRYVTDAGKEDVGSRGFLEGSVHDLFLSSKLGYHHRVTMIKNDDFMAHKVYKNSRSSLQTIKDTLNWLRGR